VAGTTAEWVAGISGIRRWLLKLDSSGNIQWQKAFFDVDIGVQLNGLNGMQTTADGGYIVAGSAASFCGCDSMGCSLGTDTFASKLDSIGNIQWQKTYGKCSGGAANSVQQTSDGGYLLSGTTYSFGAGLADAFALKLDARGNIQGQKTFGGSNDDWASTAQQTSDGGYIIAGGTYSFGAGGADMWILKVDSTGNINPGCSITGQSNAMANNANVTLMNTFVAPQNASLSPQIGSTSVTDTNITPGGVCVEGSMPVPIAPNTYSYAAVLSPSLNPNPAIARPFAIGGAAYTGETLLVGGVIFPLGVKTLSFRVGFLPFRDSVDIYLAYVFSANPKKINNLKPDLSFQFFSVDDVIQAFSTGIPPAGAIPWKQNAIGPVSAALFGTLPISGLPSGTYTVYILVTPTGSLMSYYQWTTSFVIP